VVDQKNPPHSVLIDWKDLASVPIKNPEVEVPNGFAYVFDRSTRLFGTLTLVILLDGVITMEQLTNGRYSREFLENNWY